MAVRTQCPRCKQPLSVPSKLAGSYVTCPRCQGRFWVSKDSPADPSITDSVGLPTMTSQSLPSSVAAPPLATPPVAVPPVTAPSSRAPVPAAVTDSAALSASAAAAATAAAVEPPRQLFPSVTPLAPPSPARVPPAPLPFAEEAPNPAPAAPPQALKVARLVSAEAVPSTLKLAADGQLPHLQLQESDNRNKGEGKAKSIPPAVMILAWTASVVLSAVMFMMLNTGESSVATERKKEAMAVIERDFSGNSARGDLLPYQRLLRAARQAHARSDFTAEQQYYKQVLDLLHTETRDGSAGSSSSGHLEKGITGSRLNDRVLEEKILAVLGE